MFRFLARFLSSGEGPKPSAKPSTQKFTPGLESLDGRTMPSALPLVAPAVHEATVAIAQSPDSPHATIRVDSFGVAPGGVGGADAIGGPSVSPTDIHNSTGEEIPQTV